MVRIYHPEQINQNIYLSEHVHYLAKVRRLRVSDNLIIFNEQVNCVFKIEKIEQSGIYCTKISKTLVNLEKEKISVALPMIKPSRLEWCVEKLTEIGVSEIYFYHSSRTVERNLDIKRMERISFSAVQQSYRFTPPKLINVMHLKNLLELKKQFIVLSQYGEPINKIKTLDSFKTLIIGPEGGFDENEEKLLQGHLKVQIIKETVLRSETAAIAGVVLFKNLCM